MILWPELGTQKAGIYGVAIVAAFSLSAGLSPDKALTRDNVLTREWLLNPDNSLLGSRTGAVIIEEPLANIDVEMDLKIAELLFEEGAGEFPT